jgi:D-glycero-D-manno-heptose 1,7-bisphosphate phosphatase
LTELDFKRRSAVFLDRDGVLNTDKGYVYRKEDFIWVDGAKEAIKFLNEQNYYVFVITNQSGVARGYYTEEDVMTLHHWMNEELSKISAVIHGFYYCPHLPDAVIEKYRVNCDCRKPAPGLILQAINDWPIVKEGSFLIGDSSRDVEAAVNAGIRGYLFKENNLYDYLKPLLQRNRTFT